MYQCFDVSGQVLSRLAVSDASGQSDEDLPMAS